MAHLSLRLLGAFEATLDGKPLTGFKTDKVRALLAYLAIEAGRPHRREFLAGLLWPEFPESSARANLRHALSNLRQLIADEHSQPPSLLVEGESLQLNPSSDYDLDVSSFERYTEANNQTPSLDNLQAAISLYRGSFLEGFSLRDSPAFDEWSLLVRESLQRKALLAFDKLTQAYEQRGDLEQACQLARRQVELEPWQEGAQRSLMRLLALSGKRLAALAQYEACRRSLEQELGIQPEMETIQLYEGIRDGDIRGSSEEKIRLHNLPAALSPLIGRERELAEIGAYLQDPACRLMTLIGPGGIGKTRLSLEAASQGISHFPQGAFYIPLASYESIDVIPPAIAQALGFFFPQPGDLQAQLIDYLRKKHLLLLLDNFEHLLEGVDLILEILRSAPGVKILVTSRSRLNLQEECLFPVEGLSYPQTALPDPQAALQFGSFQLFLEGARRIRLDFRPDSRDLAGIAEICFLVQGLPLAVLLAAGWMEALSPAEIAAQIRAHSLDFLETEWRDLPERQRSLRLVCDHTWRLLADRERHIFSALSVFRGGFTPPAAEAVSGASLRQLASLVGKTLLHRAPGGRFELHEFLHQYASEKLAQVPQDAFDLRQRHAAFYVKALQDWAADLKGSRQQIAMQEMDLDIENAHAAWLWAAGRGLVEQVGLALDGLCQYYEWRGRFREGEAACQAAISLVEAALPSKEEIEWKRVKAKLLAWQGLFGRVLGHIQVARQALEDALSLLDNPALVGQDTRAERAFVWQRFGDFYFDADYEQAQRCWQQSLELYRQVDDHWRLAQVLAGLGSIMEHFDAYTEANNLYMESLDIRRSLGDLSGVADTLWEIAGTIGSPEEALERYRESLAICRELGNRPGIAKCLWLLSYHLHLQGELTEAYQMQGEAAGMFEELGMRNLYAYVLHGRARAEANLGYFARARESYEIALTIAKELGDRRIIAYCLAGVGNLLALEGDPVQAVLLLQESVAILREIKHRSELSGILPDLAAVHLRLDQPVQARTCLHEALEIVVELGDLYAKLSSIVPTTLYLADQSQAELAIELYALALSQPFIANSHYYEDIAGKRIADLTTTLPPEAVAAAQARGRRRNLDDTARELLADERLFPKLNRGEVDHERG